MTIVFDELLEKKEKATIKAKKDVNQKLLWLLRMRALAYSNDENYPASLKDYTIASEVDPKDAAVYYDKGRMYENMKDLANAIVAYDECLVRKRDTLDANIFKGDAYMALEEPEKASAHA
jgi:tetratricopeptide (TPR) repeat protein